jgi:CheY-specific phosphatase CheX
MIAQTKSVLAFGAPGELPATLIAGIRQAVLSTFSMICGQEPNEQAAREQAAPCDGVIGLVSFVGDLSLSLMLGLPHATAVAMARRFTGFEILFESPDMGDVACELANVLAGLVSARLDERGLRLQMALPTVARGGDLELFFPGQVPAQRLLFSSGEGPFWVQIAAATPGATKSTVIRGIKSCT